jgi:hypothetical protein
MAHWYTPFWDLEIKKGLGFKPGWCAGEISAAPQPMILTWGAGARGEEGANGLSGWVCCCYSKKRKPFQPAATLGLLASKELIIRVL